jgi:hypothetical protein
VFLFEVAFTETMLDAIRRAIELFNDSPGTSHGEHKFTNSSLRSNRFSSTLGKDDVANFKYARIGTARVDEFAVICTMFFKQHFCNGTTIREEGRLVTSKRLNFARARCEFEVLAGREVDGEREDAAEGDKATREVSAGDGRAIPRVNEQKDSFSSYAHGLPLIGHDP